MITCDAKRNVRLHVIYKLLDMFFSQLPEDTHEARVNTFPTPRNYVYQVFKINFTERHYSAV